MASIKDVKAKAQQFLSKGNYQKALKYYQAIIDKLEEKNTPDITLYNKVGDIYLSKMDNKDVAIENFRKAMYLYDKDSLYPNAIAMAKKILKTDSNQIEMYRKIGEFNREQGLVGEALNNFINFAEKSLQNGDRKAAIEAFKDTLDMMPERIEIKEKLVDLYIQEEELEKAIEILKEIEGHYVKRNDMEQAALIRQKITKYSKQAGIDTKPKEKPQAAEKPPEEETPSEEEIDIEDFDMSDLVDNLTQELDESFSEEEEKAPASPEASAPEPETAAPQEEETQTPGSDESEIYLQYVQMGELSENYDANEAANFYYQAAEGYTSIEEYDHAIDAYRKIVSLKENEMKAHKAIIDLSIKTSQPSKAVDSYIYLAKESIDREPEKAMKLIDTVLAADPANQEAIALKGRLSKPEPAPKPAEPAKEPEQPAQAESSETDFLSEFKEEITEDISGDDLMKESEDMTARDIVNGKNEGKKPKFSIEQDSNEEGDEVWSLNELLDELKEGVNENLSDEDVSSHYDLGVSFKEMGLHDMAIEELKKSVANPEYKLKSMEMLGQCYFEKNDLETAEHTLIEAMSIKGKKPEEYLGIKYTLARIYESKQMLEQALKMMTQIKQTDASFKNIDKHIALIKEAMEKKARAEKVQEEKPAAAAETPDNGMVDFSALLKDEDISEEDESEFDDIEIDLDDDDDNKSKNISYM
ncbi:MAG: tetratricopeptide repeat protein [bacterium]